MRFLNNSLIFEYFDNELLRPAKLLKSEWLLNIAKLLKTVQTVLSKSVFEPYYLLCGRQQTHKLSHFFLFNVPSVPEVYALYQLV